MHLLPFLPESPDLARRRAVLTSAAAGLAALSALTSISACSDAREAAPDVGFTLLDGSRSSIGALRGSVVLVNFWATSCATCIQEMPLLAGTQRKYQPRGLRTLAVAMQYDPPASVAHFAETRALPFGVVIDNTGVVAREFGDVKLTPTTVLLDRRGAIARRWVGAPEPEALHALVERLLAEA